MGMSRRVRDRQKLPVRSANERFKERWSACLVWSMTAAAVAHVAVFAGWPGHAVSNRTPIPRLAIAQLVPIGLPGAPSDPRDVSTAELPDIPERERPPEEAPEADEEIDELMELIELPPPKLAHLDSPTAAELPPRTGMILKPVSAIRTGLGPSIPAFTWPELRNPRTVVRFLRTRYNPVGLDAVPERYVSVAMWVSAKGVVEWSEVRGSSGHPVVDQIALTAINEVAQFAPATRKGFPIPVAVVLSIPFERPW